jgi:hypothetical protein
MPEAQAARTMLDEALDYLNLGYPVFPVCSPLMGSHGHMVNGVLSDCPPDKRGKNPMTSWKAVQSTLPTEQQVRQWWSRWPTANIGMATGTLSGVVVLDCDSFEARQLAIDRGGLDKAPAVWTGTPGGIHYWLEHPVGEVRNFAGKGLKGLDFRGDGGYVLLPPSVHRNQGAKYRWAEHTIGMRPAPIPPWLMDLLHGTGGETSADEHELGEALDLEAILAGIGQGARDDTLWRYAGKLRGDNVPQAYAEQLIRQAAALCRPAFDADAAVEKVRRAYREFQPRTDFGAWDAEIEKSAAETVGNALPDVEAEQDWQVFDAETFLAIEYPPVEWRIEGYLRDRGILFSYGPPGAIKTYVATDAGLAIASGGKFLGQFQCQQGRVLVVQEDTLASDYQQAYLRPMLAARGLTGADVRDTLFVAPQADFALDRNDRLEALCGWLDVYHADLLILDSFYLMYSGRREDLLTVLKIVKKIRNKYGCSIWIIDHNRKGQGDASGENPIDRLINGREKSAAVDVVMESRPVKGESGSVFLDVLKLRGVKLPEAVRVTYSDGRFTVDGDEEVTPTGASHTVYEWLCREGGSRTIRQIMSGVGLADRTVREALAELHRDGLARPWGKVGTAKTWLAIRRSEATPEEDLSFNFGMEDEE